jgi:NTP pyrophosphatase (non-canonical NTP hydrolase)
MFEDNYVKLSGATHSAIDAESMLAQLKHTERSMFGKNQTDGDRLAILVEEVGEVAKAINEKKNDELVKELIQVAAMAASWLQIEDGGPL